MENSKYLTVTALTEYIKRKFDADPYLRKVYVQGELSNVKIHTSGHLYFTLKDENSRIRAAMYYSNFRHVKFTPENGQKVIISGDVSVYEVNGEYNLYVKTMEPDGVGGLFVAYNQLLEKLKNEGLFQERFKQPIPTFPEKIGVLTATTGAAIRDICTTLKRRYPLAEILVYPTIVQGAQAAPNIVKNIQLANRQNLCDVLIVGRGGGSIEDLWAFNEEIVARAIFESKIPIISAVGHETDTTIADFVSDMRAATPTAAAEIAVPDKNELYNQILRRKSNLSQMIQGKIKLEKSKLEKLKNSYVFETPEKLYRPYLERVIQLETQLEKSSKLLFMKSQNDLEKLKSSLKLHSPKNEVKANREKLNQMVKDLTALSHQLVNKEREAFSSSIRTLEALNPLSVMNRGFTITYKKKKLINSVKKLKKDDEITVKFADGEATAKVISKRLEEKK